MTEQYKIGDRVLWDAKIGSIATDGKIWLTSMADESRGIFPIDPKELRPYTPRQEFEYGEIVEVSNNEKDWSKALYVGRSHNKMQRNLQFVVNIITDIGLKTVGGYMYCRKLTNKKETLTIGGVDYYKDDVEKALKDLKPVEGK